MESGQDIIKTGLVSREQLDKALELQGETGENLTYIICKMRLADENELTKALALDSNTEVDYLEDFTADAELAEKFTAEFLEDNLAVPLRRVEGMLQIGLCNLPTEDTLDELRMIAGEKVEIVLIPAIKARETLDKLLYSEGSDSSEKRKVPQKRQHHSARETLGDLVEELESEAQQRDDGAEIDAAELYSYETRELLFALIDTLVERGLVSREELSIAAANLRNH